MGTLAVDKMPLTWPEPEELVLTADDLNVGLLKARFDQKVARFWEASRNTHEVKGTDVKLQLQPYVDQIECQFGKIISAKYYLGLKNSVKQRGSIHICWGCGFLFCFH